jgi:hypothetical protein
MDLMRADRDRCRFRWGISVSMLFVDGKCICIRVRSALVVALLAFCISGIGMIPCSLWETVLVMAWHS